MATILLIGGEAMETSAQTPDAVVDESTETRRWWLLSSEASPENRVIWAGWSLHLRWAHQGFFYDGLVGVAYRGVFAGAFTTSYEDWGFLAGIERKWFGAERGPLAGMLGFRTGLIYGYDEQLGWMAGKSPILPMFQPMLYGRLGPLTADVTYTWVVVSITAGLRF
jgi:hypothetical protein